MCKPDGWISISDGFVYPTDDLPEDESGQDTDGEEQLHYCQHGDEYRDCPACAAIIDWIMKQRETWGETT